MLGNIEGQKCWHAVKKTQRKMSDPCRGKTGAWVESWMSGGMWWCTGMSATAHLLNLTVHVGEERVQYYLLFVVVTGSICRLRPARLVFKNRSLFYTGLKSGNMFFNLLLISDLRLLSRSLDIWIFFVRSNPKSQNVTKNVVLKFHLNKASLMEFLCRCSSLTQVRAHQTHEDTTCLHRYLL